MSCVLGFITFVFVISLHRAGCLVLRNVHVLALRYLAAQHADSRL